LTKYDIEHLLNFDTCYSTFYVINNQQFLDTKNKKKTFVKYLANENFSEIEMDLCNIGIIMWQGSKLNQVILVFLQTKTGVDFFKDIRL